MFHWIIDSKGRLVKISIPHKSNSEFSLDLNPMKPPPEQQQSWEGVERNPNAYRFMRDYIHPPQMSAPSCIVPSIKPFRGFPVSFSTMAWNL